LCSLLGEEYLAWKHKIIEDSIAIEAKQDIHKFNRHQMIATAVFSSFNEQNLYPEVNPLVPVILISIPDVVFCLYMTVQRICFF